MKLDERPRIDEELKNLNDHIKWESEELEEKIQYFKEYVANANSYHIATFLHEKSEEIVKKQECIQVMKEKRDMLEWIKGE